MTQTMASTGSIDLPAYRDPSLPLQERLTDLIIHMNLEEKIAQLFCVGRAVEMEGILFQPDGSLDQEKMASLFRNGICQLGRPSQKRPPRAAAELTNAIQRYLVEETRLGIPALFNEEGLHGLMGVGATSFPQAIALASTWDTALIEQIFAAVAHETRARGSNYVYTPVLDLARDPRWGRVEETFGEDPYLVSRMGVAAIHGLQGRHRPIDSTHVIAVAKHFAVHGQPEGGTNAAPGNISERLIREQFLPPFEAAVKEAHVEAVMASYNEIDGVPAHVNPWLLDQVLRQEWGFPGFVTSDGFAIPQLLILHHVADQPGDAARMALLAGVDCEVPQGICYPSLLQEHLAGRVPEAAIDRAVRRILRAKFLLGLFDELPQADPDEAERIANSPEHRQLALQAARQAIVLLKNEAGLLPLDRGALRSIGVIGPTAADLHLGGYAEDPGRGVTLLEGIRQAAGGQIAVSYAEGCRISTAANDWRGWAQDEVHLPDPTEDDERIAEALRLASQVDLVVLALGENESTCREAWWFNHLGDRDDLNLLGRQEELARSVLETGKPVVVVLTNGRPLTINYLAQNAPAILECWYLGQEGGTALGEVLFGEVNPSGKLPVTFPRSVGQLPVYYYQKPSARRGYLFTSTEPLFPFGFGLSYTQFSYSNLRLSPAQIAPGESARVQVEVTNAGSRAGDEIVQLYIHDQVSTITRPVKELKDFCRLSLRPGETQTVEFVLTAEKLASLDQNMQWRVEPGLFDVMVGGSSVDTLNVVLQVTGPAKDI
jgi:beta-glucosidase